MGSLNFRLVALALPCLMLASAARAADAISTDRPDFVESSDVMDPGRWQIETGFQSERDASRSVRTRTRTTPTLLRFGVSDTLEFRVETDGRTLERTSSSTLGASGTQRGWADLGIGVKWHVKDGSEEQGTPGMAWLLHVDADTGSSAFRGQGLRPSLRFVAEWDLPHETSLGVMPGIAMDRNADGRRHAVGIFAVSASTAWTPARATYLEVAAQRIASKANGGSVITFDAGATYLVNDALKLDLSMARGLTRESPDFAWGIGASIRF